METIRILAVVLAALGISSVLVTVIMWLVKKQLDGHIGKLKKSMEDAASNQQQRMDEMAIQIHDIDIRTSRISEDRARVPIASRQSWTKFVTPIRDAVDKHPLGGA